MVALWPRLIALSQAQVFYTSFLKSIIEISNVYFDKDASHPLMRLKLQRIWGLLTRKVGKPIHMQFSKGKRYKAKEVAMHITLECGTLDFCEDFKLFEIDEVYIIINVTFFEIHMVYVLAMRL